MPWTCPVCEEERERVLVFQDEDAEPFACQACAEDLDLAAHGVPLDAAAREAWPSVPEEERRARAALALSERLDLVTDGGMDCGTASIDLVNAAARLLERGK